MKKLLILCLLVSLAGTSFAQSGNEKSSAFHLSFFPPLSTNGKYAGEYTNTVSFSMLVGLSKNEQVASIAGLGNIVRNNANGLQFAGLWNYAGNSGSGVMLSGLANIVRNDHYGLQFSGLWNYIGNRGSGVMVSGLANIARNDYHGFQFAGLVNTSDGLGGVQIGMLGNRAGNVTGFQMSGLANISKNITGFQFGALGNIAGDVSGLQFAGLFNVAKRVSGVQFAGLLNIAESSDCPIAILNIIKNGEYGVGISYNEMGNAMVSLRSGGRVTYGIIGIGYNHKDAGDGLTTEAGFGAHINIAKWFRINNEIKAGSIDITSSDDNTFYANYALLPAFRPFRHLEIFGGPSINYMQSNNMGNKSLFPGNSLWKKHTDTKLQQVYIGWQAGVQFIF